MAIQVQARFAVGQLIKHRLFHYRGVIIDADPCFQGSEQWYQSQVELSLPREEPWYHILVHGASHHVYVPESDLELDQLREPIHHPDLEYFFTDFVDGVYLLRPVGN